jgi:hypothetical protein
MLGSDLLTRAAIVLQDDAHTRWPLPELVMWINDGMKAIVLAKPSANTETVVLSLAYGTLQTLGAGYLSLLRMPRNITATTPNRIGGRIIRPTSREVLDASAPDWHDPDAHPYKKEVRQYVYDEANPREYYVYPGNLSTGQVEAQVAVLPDNLAATGDVDTIGSYATELSLVDPWDIPLLDFVLFRAFSKDDIGADLSRARIHYQAFAAAVGLKAQAENANSPNARARVTSA